MKDHTCSVCGGIITKGEKCYYYETRAPKFDHGDVGRFPRQDGIEYIKLWFRVHYF